MHINRTLSIALIALVIILLSAPAQSDIIKKGQVGFRFLENPISAEAVGRGGMGVSLLRNANAAFWNPAGVSWIESQMDLRLNHTNGIADINVNSAAFAVQLGGFAVMAADLVMMDYGDFYGTRRANNALGFEDTETFSPQAYALGLTFSQKVSDRFSYGVRVKYAHQDLGSTWIGVTGKDVDDPELVMEQKEYALSEPAIDVGAVYDFLAHGIRFGAAIQNFSREIRYEDEKFPLPFAVSFSLTVDPFSFFNPLGDEHRFLVGFETRHPRDFQEKVQFGIDYTYLNLLMVRLGYMGNFDERGLTAGLGVHKKFQGQRVFFDYAYQDFGVFNAVHLFSFGLGL
ncbi:MAG TPA: PorV/PorQ family protein [bacterium]|nr:PorV/PorQ family protein [bacterium]HNT66500.1 PorV/PorQ family protein [bacterium]HOX85577.1 PorV/PorQ family protein [bacterium]HPG44736.1 PorV/PorQ family protein [bacterium]HPM99092.1 PorV/PorQ family protein [bacterium]